VAFGSLDMLECDPPGFQSDEHASRGYCGAFLQAEGSTAYEDEYLSFVSRCWILLWRLCKHRNKVVLSIRLEQMGTRIEKSESGEFHDVDQPGVSAESLISLALFKL